MLRKLNFTDRAKLAKTQIHIALRRERDGVLAFDPVFSIDGTEAPADARLFIEAYHRTSFQRFDCGFVGAISIPEDRRLTGIDGTSVRFRVKIVGADRRILAVADDIRVTERAPAAAGRVALLPVEFTSALDQQAWRVSFEPDTPVLQLNNGIDGIETMAREDALFFALVYPAAVRSILTQILLVDRHDAFEDGTEWWGLWIQWAMRQTAAPLPADSEDAALWIEDVVAAFAAQHAAVDRLSRRDGEPS